MKVIFLGTPEFAVPTLTKLIQNHTVVAVVTQPDKPQGRSNKLVPSPVKVLALKHNIPVLQYRRIRKEGVSQLKSYNADVMVTCAYGQILSQEILDITPIGVLNVHGSLLPKYRGAAPIQWAIINGEKYTGVTILRSEAGMDDGDVLIKKRVKILENETSEELFSRLSEVGSNLLISAMQLIVDNKAVFKPQNHKLATTCKMLKKEMAVLDFNLSATTLKNLIHGLNPWPICHLNINGTIFKLYKSEVLSEQEVSKFVTNLNSYNIGSIVISNSKRGLVIKCGEDYLSLLEIQPQNGKRMPTKSYLNGKQIPVGSIVISEVDGE